MKVALCVQVKLENNYIRQWIKYHKNLGFDNIIVFDNNDFDGEKLEDVIDDYIDSGYVIIDRTYINKQCVQIASYNKCIHDYRDKYDWIGIWDLDEYLYLGNYTSIQDFIQSNDKFTVYDSIGINWVSYGDNGYIEVHNHDVLHNFDNVHNISKNPLMQTYFKSLINCNRLKRYDDVYFSDAHRLSNPGVQICDVSGNYIWGYNGCIQPNTVEGVYLKHFITKSLSEFISQKRQRGINWQIFGDPFELYKNVNSWIPEYDNYVKYKIDNIQQTKKILVCIFYNESIILETLKNTYIKTIEEYVQYHNIDYWLIKEENASFDVYYNTFHKIMDEGNQYDFIVCVNQQTFINIHLLDRFINIIADEGTVYTNIIQQRLTNKDICERFFIISKKHIPQIINANIIKENPQCMGWFPFYTLNIIFGEYNIDRITPIGNIDFMYNQYNDEDAYQLNDRTISIISWTIDEIITEYNIDSINNEFNKINDFVNTNKDNFILRMHHINMGHIGQYKELNGEDCRFIYAL